MRQNAQKDDAGEIDVDYVRLDLPHFLLLASVIRVHFHCFAARCYHEKNTAQSKLKKRRLRAAAAAAAAAAASSSSSKKKSSSSEQTKFTRMSHTRQQTASQTRDPQRHPHPSSSSIYSVTTFGVFRNPLAMPQSRFRVRKSAEST